MTITEAADIMEAEVLCPGAEKDGVVLQACACDLLSDVLRCVSGPKTMLLTNLTHPQTVRVAEIVDATAVCFMRGKKPAGEAIELAKTRGIALLCTELSTYEASGRLYSRGLSECGHE